MTEPDFARVAIVGLGLMGGSMALALRERQTSAEVIGIDNNPAAREHAASRGIAVEADLSAIAGADVVVLATPVRAILEQLPLVGEQATVGALVLDIGSTKREIVNKMKALPERLEPVGGHPMCGKESAGIESAEASLYRDAAFVLSPLPRTGAETLAKAETFVRGLGARPTMLDPDRHDRIVGMVSHVPFALATSLVNLALTAAQSDDMALALAASGFRDTSRLAASDSKMMLDTLLTNRDNVSELLRTMARELDVLADTIAAGDEQTLMPILERAARRRREMFK